MTAIGTGAILLTMSPHPALDPQSWTVLYDADCGFCRWSLAMILRADRRRRLRPVALQSPEANVLLADLRPAERMASWHLISPNGARRSAGEALPALAALLPGGRLAARGLARTAALNDRGYRWAAAHRPLLGRPISDRAKRRADELIAERSTHMT
jgi:predicted DCC family thiol-disulfide oxidoreductase YuxK